MIAGILKLVFLLVCFILYTLVPGFDFRQELKSKPRRAIVAATVGLAFAYYSLVPFFYSDKFSKIVLFISQKSVLRNIVGVAIFVLLTITVVLLIKWQRTNRKNTIKNLDDFYTLDRTDSDNSDAPEKKVDANDTDPTDQSLYPAVAFDETDLESTGDFSRISNEFSDTSETKVDENDIDLMDQSLDPEFAFDEADLEGTGDFSRISNEFSDTSETKVDENDLMNQSLNPEFAFDEADLESAGDFSEIANEIAKETLSEADVYLAYYLYDQAIEMLNKAIGHQPDNFEYVLKLLQALHAKPDPKAFKQSAEKYHRHFGGDSAPNWLRVCEMGQELLPNNVMFDHS